jgi:aspartyl-tRNA(Asn)/glutamyl-tRNA(Gln) amidotransferase subunit A
MTNQRDQVPQESAQPGGKGPAAGIFAALSMTEIVQAVRNGALTPVELVTAALESIEQWQPVTNAASRWWPDEALAAARALPDDPQLALRGVPVLVKEQMDVAGHHSTACSEAFRNRVAIKDSRLVTRLKAAGALIIGKANMHELAASATNHVSACGPTHNPWDPQRLTGGSSGGSAAAVATRSVPLTLGTDTAGSIRIPSSLCGVTGLKPTHDRLSMDGVMPLAPSFGCPGPIAATAEDLGLAFAVLADQPEALGRMHVRLRGLQVGRVANGYYSELIHPDVRAALDHVAEVVAADGARLVTVALAGMDDASRVWADTAWTELTSSYPELDLAHVGRQIVEHYQYGQHLPAARRTWARARAFGIRDSFLTALRQVDALLLPCTPYPAPCFTDDAIEVGEGQFMNVFSGGPIWFTCPVNIAGLPSLALPGGFTRDGLPVGVQLVGRPGGEWTLLRLGSAFQARTTYHRRIPSLPITAQTRP